MDAPSEPLATPEVEPVTSLLFHPLLQDPVFLAAVGGLILLVLFTAAFRPGDKSRSRRSGTPTVLLVGPSDGGKTALFAQLVHGTRIQTHTSTIPSDTTFPLFSPYPSDTSRKPIRLIDLPGHPRLRDELKTYIKEASAVIFVVDVVGVVRNAGAIAEEIPPILTSLANAAYSSSSTTKFLLLAHKSDLLIRPTPTNPTPTIPASTRTSAVDRIRTILAREMDRLKSARGAVGGKIEGMGHVSGGGGGWWARLFGGSGASAEAAEGQEAEEDEGLVWGGQGGWRWEDIEGVEVEWAASALGSIKDIKAEGVAGEGLDELKEFLWNL